MLRIELEYTGFKVTECDKTPGSKSAKLKIAYQNIGALTMRVQLSQSQRIALLESSVRHHYSDNPIEIPSAGGDETGLFAPELNSSETYRTTRRLEKYAHYTLGKGKILSERAQPQKDRNVKSLRGEEFLWDSLHAPIWSSGINLPGQLDAQGFVYVCHPEKMSEQEYKCVSDELQQGRFKIIEKDCQKFVITDSGIELKTSKFTNVCISMDPDFKRTYQKNGFIITANGSAGPIGWTIHAGKEAKLVDTQYTQDILRITAIARGGTNKLSKKEFDLLLVHNNRGYNTDIRHTQNRNLNLLEGIAQALERDFTFDASGLLGNLLKASYMAIQKKSQESDVIEDFLTGALLTEMVQSLKLTQSRSARPKLPSEFQDSFDWLQNMNKAFAYAFDLKKPDGSLVFNADAVPFTPPDNGLVDVRMQGTLAEPDLTNPKHVAALISTGVLVAEQMILEQLLRSAVMFGAEHPHVVALRKILGDDEMYHQLVTMACNLPRDESGPIMGLQIPASERILQVLRKALGLDHLIKMADEFDQANGVMTVSEEDKNNSLHKLYQIGKTLQSLDGISAAAHGSRGINAGIVPVIARIAPELHAKLVVADRLTPAPDKSKAPMKVINEHPENDGDGKDAGNTTDTNNSASARGCPFAAMMRNAAPASSTSWCQFFTRKVLPVGIAAAGVAAVAYYVTKPKH